MNVLQALVLPNLDLRLPEDLYVRVNEAAWAEMAEPRLHLRPGGLAWTDTFYNSLSVGVWKRHCDIRWLVLRLQGEGELVVSIGLHRLGHAHAWLGEHRVSLTPGQAVHVPVRGWETVNDGMLFLRFRALSDAVVEHADYLTPDVAPNDVRLGLVITHFNRQAQVLPAIDRITRSVLARPDLAPHITLTVVDNSRNLPLEDRPAVRHIPNTNLGGTGGFVRGLLSLIDGGAHTHALFMDDDASCETESIARTFALLRYSRDPKLAVCGSLLREMAPWHLLEKGARFDGEVRAISPGLDMRRVDHLLEAERNLVRPDYGAWWFFAFPLAEIKRFPFPFFVRGDDIHFGLVNRFKIATLNGVACLGEDFSAKHGPMTAYLDARYHLVLALLLDQSVVSRIFWVASRLFMKQLTSYHYTGARAVTLGLCHVAEGPDFFRRNLDLQAVRSEIGRWTPSEKLLPIDRSELQLKAPRNKRESLGRRLARIFTMQGFLLPKGLIRDRTTVQEKAFHGRASAVFRYRRVLYEHSATGTGYIAEYDRARFFGELRRFLGAWAHLMRRLPALRRQYGDSEGTLASETFWRGVYGLPPRPAAGSADDGVVMGSLVDRHDGAASASLSPRRSLNVVQVRSGETADTGVDTHNA